MSVLRRYLTFLLAWTTGFSLLFLAMGVTGPGGQGYGAMARLPALLGFGMALGSFPAGIAVSATVLAGSEPLGRRVFTQLGLSVLASVLMFGIVGYWAPSALARGSRTSALTGVPEVAHLTNPQLRDIGRPAQDAAYAAGEGRISDWQEINTIAWEHERRSAHASLPFLLSWVGIFAAYWASRLRRRELTLAMLWAMGLFIFMSLYLAGENSFELIAIRAGGPVFFAAWFIVFVPAALFGTLGWTTAIDLLGTQDPEV